MPLGDALILGLVQGTTEFLPVSSTGHLILARSLLGLPETGGLAFDASLHLATALAIIIYFAGDFLRIIRAVLSRVFGRAYDEEQFRLFTVLVIGTIPAAVIGFLFQDAVEATFRNPILVASALIAGSLIFLAAELRLARTPPTEARVPSLRSAVIIGFWQCLALIPGVSRSGATISGGMFNGLSRETAARFSFLLSLPIILGAGGLELVKTLSDNTAAVPDLLVGATAAFISGILAIWVLMYVVRRYSLVPFVIYRLLLAAGVFYVVFT